MSQKQSTLNIPHPTQNGKPGRGSARNVNIQTNGAAKAKHRQPKQQSVTENSLFHDLCNGLSEAEGDDHQAWLLDNADLAAEMTDADVSRFILFARGCGIPKTWLERDWKKAIKIARKQMQSVTSDSGALTTAAHMTAITNFGYTLRLNDMDSSIEVNGVPFDDIQESVILNKMYDAGFKVEGRVRRVLMEMAGNNRYHPVKDFFDRLEWDGEDHIAALSAFFPDIHAPIKYPDGTERTVFHAYLRRWLVGAIAKVLELAQNVTLVLDGAQGEGKSYLPYWLASPLPELHNEDQIDPDDPELKRQLAATWIWEIGELPSTTSRADVNSLKRILTQIHVRFRHPYARYNVQKPVLASFIGTLNDDGNGFLRDLTGNRRYACLTLQSIDKSYSEEIDVSQVWAQAVALYRAGEPWVLLEIEKRTQGEVNKAFQVESTIDTMMGELFVCDPSKTEIKMSPIAIGEILRTHGYSRDIDKCNKDAAAWLKRNKHEKIGKPPTWRGIRERTEIDEISDQYDGFTYPEYAEAKHIDPKTAYPQCDKMVKDGKLVRTNESRNGFLVYRPT